MPGPQKEVSMPRMYPPEFRPRILDLIASGRKVADVARDLGVSDQTICNWRKQDLIDRGERPGLRGAAVDAGSLVFDTGADGVSV
jgi:transposase-like protein